MEMNSNSSTGTQKHSASLFTNIWDKMTALFMPEEVEVTFKEDVSGHIISYTYTVVDEHKQVA